MPEERELTIWHCPLWLEVCTKPPNTIKKYFLQFTMALVHAGGENRSGRKYVEHLSS